MVAEADSSLGLPSSRHTYGVRVLAVSDVVDEAISASMPARSGTIDLVIGAGDLPYEYLDYIATAVGAPLRAVHGNHDQPPEDVDDNAIRVWWDGIDLHGRVVDLNVRLEPAPSHTIAGELGYGTGQGARVEVDWTDRNFFNPEGALTLRGIAGTKEQLAAVQFMTRPIRRIVGSSHCVGSCVSSIRGSTCTAIPTCTTRARPR